VHALDRHEILLEKREFELGRLGTSVDIASDNCFFGSFCYEGLRLTMAVIPQRNGRFRSHLRFVTLGSFTFISSDLSERRQFSEFAFFFL